MELGYGRLMDGAVTFSCFDWACQRCPIFVPCVCAGDGLPGSRTPVGDRRPAAALGSAAALHLHGVL
jgi:hypothetical protein